MSSRSQIRRRIRQHRRDLTDAQRHEASCYLFYNLISTRQFLNSRRIACYLANDGELDIAAVMIRAWRMKKSVFLPVLDTLRSNRLWFAPYHEGDSLVRNRFGIPEPATSRGNYIAARELDLILMPLVAFDEAGNRLGMGGGYYDRTLAHLRFCHHWSKPNIIGIGYDFQRITGLVRQKWDVPMQGIVTDRHIYRVTSNLE